MTMAGMTIPWALPADLSLLWWLEKAGYDYDLITDHDLDREGVSALEPYKVILNVTRAVIGAILIGFLEAFIGSIPFLGQRYVMFATFSFIIAVLVIRPRGISGLLDDTRE